MPPIGRQLMATLGLSLLLLLVACSGPAPTYVDAGATYDAASVAQLVETSDPGSLADERTDDAADLRHRYLVKLRSQGEGAAAAVSLLNRTFPTDVAAVPFYVERATYEQTPAFVVVEALGRPGTTLSDKRLWVIDESGDVLFSGTR